MARRAEKAFNFERADTQSFIKFGHWEGLRKGLLAGDRLALDLRRMDSAYHSQNKREYELTKTISIAELDPDAFMSIREGLNGGGTFTLGETRFDEDFPTHHLRRIKSASISVHCTPGAYQAVNGRLTLLNAETRPGPSATDVTAWSGAVASTATSMAQNDGGTFEMSFQDARYLPFEGAGAHAGSIPATTPQWRFELMGGNEFPFDSISDVVMQLRYTAREGRLSYTPPTPITRKTLWRAKYAFADALQAYAEGSSTTIDLVLPPDRFPKARNRGSAVVTALRLYAKWTGGTTNWAVTTPAAVVTTFGNGTAFGSYYTVVDATLASPGFTPTTELTLWKLTPPVTPPLGTPRAVIEDLWISFTYTSA